MLVYLTKNCFNIGNRCQSEKYSFKYEYVSTVDRFIQKSRFSDIEIYFDEIRNVHFCDLNNGEEEHQYSMQEMVVDIVDYCYNLKVLILKNLNFEYFNLV